MLADTPARGKNRTAAPRDGGDFVMLWAHDCDDNAEIETRLPLANVQTYIYIYIYIIHRRAHDTRSQYWRLRLARAALQGIPIV